MYIFHPDSIPINAYFSSSKNKQNWVTCDAWWYDFVTLLISSIYTRLVWCILSLPLPYLTCCPGFRYDLWVLAEPIERCAWPIGYAGPWRPSVWMGAGAIVLEPVMKLVLPDWFTEYQQKYNKFQHKHNKNE